MLGHILGLLCGVAALAACGILTVPNDVPLTMEWPRVMACALALGLTSTATFALRVEHPPAGATTLIIAFGVCPVGLGLVTFVCGVALLLVLTTTVHRLRGVDYPIWRAREAFQIGTAT
jgi:CBS-domain-containing membrane protein